MEGVLESFGGELTFSQAEMVFRRRWVWVAENFWDVPGVVERGEGD